MTSGRWWDAATGMKNSPIAPSPVTAALNRPTDTDGSLTKATPQNTEKAATNISDAAIHGSCGEELVRATALSHHVATPTVTNRPAPATMRNAPRAPAIPYPLITNTGDGYSRTHGPTNPGPPTAVGTVRAR
ncbi:hypothetical protein PV396_18855 [Streptomyces sp. ME02-8801-2C]|uniref:hypothetical protein n=1 Tax=Streptomyces sp. ME02-8801-2C TaxID=3028680 RepID=UPI0029B7481C|nr:hypothetical protein [Streptomyces sp. ME02-8801-2C]MDX3453982.1 hypothetical protein [Streptomyces sp. ME02-8801-2C]